VLHKPVRTGSYILDSHGARNTQGVLLNQVHHLNRPAFISTRGAHFDVPPFRLDTRPHAGLLGSAAAHPRKIDAAAYQATMSEQEVVPRATHPACKRHRVAVSPTPRIGNEEILGRRVAGHRKARVRIALGVAHLGRHDAGHGRRRWKAGKRRRCGGGGHAAAAL